MPGLNLIGVSLLVLLSNVVIGDLLGIGLRMRFLKSAACWASSRSELRRRVPVHEAVALRRGPILRPKETTRIGTLLISKRLAHILINILRQLVLVVIVVDLIVGVVPAELRRDSGVHGYAGLRVACVLVRMVREEVVVVICNRVEITVNSIH